MEPKVSVIVPVYQAGKTLEKCVESLIFGSYRNLEVILVEDCSTDDSWALCQKLSEAFGNVRCVRNSENRGVSYTRNRGAAMADGAYICFVDSDDWVSGNYVNRLVETAERFAPALTICGFRFHEEAAGYWADYLWDAGVADPIPLPGERFFALQQKSLLQSVCNKIFRRDIVMAHQLRFDESQTMGEDFQFVLDYLEAAGIRQCVMINEPLYHYIRRGSGSLMSQFGLIGREQEQMRLQQLQRICGDSEQTRDDYQRAVAALKRNYVYHIVRHSAWTRERRIREIQQVLAVGNGRRIYREQRILMLKEGITGFLGRVRKLPARVDGRWERKRLCRFIKSRRRLFSGNGERITILSQNCIGGVLYGDLGMAFASPTIGLFFRGEDFVRFVENLEDYLELEPEMRWGDAYPVGRLDDVQIHFMHYETCSAAKNAWNRRKERVNRENILVLCTDMEGFTDDLFARWKALPYRKLLFTANGRFAEDKDSLFYPAYQAGGSVPDLIPKREFYRDGRVMDLLRQDGKPMKQKNT